MTALMLAGVFQLTTEYARSLQAMSLKERKAEARKRVEQVMQACKAAGGVTLEKVMQSTRQPEPYRQPSKMTVTEVQSRPCCVCGNTLYVMCKSPQNQSDSMFKLRRHIVMSSIQ